MSALVRIASRGRRAVRHPGARTAGRERGGESVREEEGGTGVISSMTPRHDLAPESWKRTRRKRGSLPRVFIGQSEATLLTHPDHVFHRRK